jgi:hypothetical protein
MNTQDLLRILQVNVPQPVIGAPTGEYVSTYRGYRIFKIAETQFDVWSDYLRIASAPSAWGCITYIDESLSP